MTYLNMALSAFTPGTIVPTLSLKTDRGARKDRLPASLSNSTMLTLSVDDCPFGSGEASALPTTRELWAPRKQIGIGTRLETHARGKRADSVVRLTESEGATLKRGHNRHRCGTNFYSLDDGTNHFTSVVPFSVLDVGPKRCR